MSAIAFTPEPLFVHDATTVVNGHRTGTLDIKTIDKKWIADVKPYGDTFPDYEDAKAYAKLFAAAPDLLDAAKYAMECLERLGNSGDNGDQACVALKAAIDKATL